MALTKKEWGIIEGQLRRRIMSESARIQRKGDQMKPSTKAAIEDQIRELLDIIEKVQKEKNNVLFSEKIKSA